MANGKNFHVRLVRKEKDSNRWCEDKVVNQIIFVERAGYNDDIETLYQAFKDMALPEDIKLQYAHSWDAESRVGCPDSFLVSLGKEGYQCPDSNISWFQYEEGTEKARGRQFYVYHKDCIASLKRMIWKESALSKVKWERSEAGKKSIEARQFHPDLPYEWWL